MTSHHPERTQYLFPPTQQNGCAALQIGLFSSPGSMAPFWENRLLVSSIDERDWLLLKAFWHPMTMHTTAQNGVASSRGSLMGTLIGLLVTTTQSNISRPSKSSRMSALSRRGIRPAPQKPALPLGHALATWSRTPSKLRRSKVRHADRWL